MTHLLLIAGVVIVIGACCISRFAEPDWTGAIVGALAVVGVLVSFAAGRLSRD